VGRVIVRRSEPEVETRIIATLTIGLMVPLLNAGTATAQTPAPAGSRVAPIREVTCTVRARPNEEFLDLLFSRLGTPLATVSPDPEALIKVIDLNQANLPEGRPADAAEISNVARAVSLLYSCGTLQGDDRKMLSMLSDDMIRLAVPAFFVVLNASQNQNPSLLYDAATLDAFLDRLGFTPASSSYRPGYVHDVRVLPDGRIRAVMEPEGVTLVFVAGPDHLLIDRIYLPGDQLAAWLAEASSHGTPTPWRPAAPKGPPALPAGVLLHPPGACRRDPVEGLRARHARQVRQLARLTLPRSSLGVVSRRKCRTVDAITESLGILPADEGVLL
jgi:hypothetical protein